MKHDFSTRRVCVCNERNILYKTKRRRRKNTKYSIFDLRYLYIMSLPSRKNNALTTTTRSRRTTTTNRNKTFEEIGQRTKGEDSENRR